MIKKPLLLLVLACTCLAAQAQSSPAKKELVARILKIQQAGIESMARSLAEEPAIELLARADQALPQRVPADKRQAVAKDIQADVKKYTDEAIPVVRSAAVKLAPSTVGALLEKEFSEDELKQVLAFLESPAYLKFQKLGPDMQKVLLEKLVAETRAAVEPKVRELENTIGRRIGVTAPAAAAKPASR